MYKDINCTTIILVPKVDKPTTVKEFRPITCYILLYKLIFKVLAAILQKIIAIVISENQVGFIPGRRMAS